MMTETADIETSSEGYARRFAGPVGRWMLDLQEAIVTRWMADLPRCAVLDVGGGHAQLARPLAAAGHAVTVLGSDESCRERLRPEADDGRIRFTVGDVVNLPFADDSFDTVVCIRLLPHCGQWQRLVAELARVARRRVIVDYPARRSVNSLSSLFFPLKKGIEGNTRPFRVFSHPEVANAFSAVGFALERRKPQFFLPMALHRVLKSPPFSSGLERAFAALGLTAVFGSPVLTAFAPRRLESSAANRGPPETGPVADEA